MFYSQDKQDKFLETKVFRGHKNGFFVDVGSHDGISINNTLYFEKNNGWTGINIEPLGSVYKKLVANRPNCINLEYAVCNNDGIAEFRCNTGYDEMLSGLNDCYDRRHVHRINSEQKQYGGESRIVKVNTRRLASIFAEHDIRHVNYLSIDVEGAEFEVIKSIDFDKVFIDVIGFENNYQDVSKPIVKYLRDKGYIGIHKGLDIIMINTESVFYKQKKVYK